MPPDLYDVQLQAIPDRVAVFDESPTGSWIGELVVDVNSSTPFQAGSGAEVSATWWGANPRSDLKRGSTFSAVERYREDSGDWVVVANDADFFTKFAVKRPDPKMHLEQIQATVSWQVPSDATPGTHRLRYLGVATLQRATEAFEALSSSFEVVAPSAAAVAVGTSKKPTSAISAVDLAVVPKKATAPALSAPLPL
jgi:neutral ceramidase